MNDIFPVLPAFSSDGVLPPGDYVLTLEQIMASPLVRGPVQASEAYPHWDAGWRAKLVENLAIMTRQL
jgi:hypothetical protein